MRKLLLLLSLIPAIGSKPAEAVLVQADITALRLDAQTVRLQVADVGVFGQGNLYQLFGVSPISPFGNSVFIGPYGDPFSVLHGDFGNPVGFEGDVHPVGPGQTQAFGYDYAIDVLSPPWAGFVDLGFHGAQDYFYEYLLPNGSTFRDVAGRVEGDLHFIGYLPTSVGDRTDLHVTPEPRPVALLAAGLLLLGLSTHPARRRSTR
jgi:hypothetical protein